MGMPRKVSSPLQLIRKSNPLICGIIKSGITAGVFRKCDVEITAYGFLGMCSWAYQWYPGMSEKVSTQKLAETLCDTFLQGLNKPVNDLSRGATVHDIVNTVAITAIQAQGT
mgnify:CR=1 FL=1